MRTRGMRGGIARAGLAAGAAVRIGAALGAAVCALLSGCASWRTVEVTESWTLFAPKGAVVDAQIYERALEPAFEAVEERLGPFERRVRINAWLSEESELLPPKSNVKEVPGIGPARVRAFHVRSGVNPFAADGVFLGTTETGTVVHELVHARLAEVRTSVPLWFEEGLASFCGDGALYRGRWQVDGLVCWPLRELRTQKFELVDFERLLALDARADVDARDNLLVHFLGWALVFDLARERPAGTWSDWLELWNTGVEREGRAAHAQRRLARTLDASSELAWLERLGASDPAVRFAAARGTWKLRSRAVLDLLLDALQRETEPEVRYALALNAFLTATERPSGRSRSSRLRELAFAVLREPDLPDQDERVSAQNFYASVFSRVRGRSQQDLEGLTRFWEE